MLLWKFSTVLHEVVEKCETRSLWMKITVSWGYVEVGKDTKGKGMVGVQLIKANDKWKCTLRSPRECYQSPLIPQVIVSIDLAWPCTDLARISEDLIVDHGVSSFSKDQLLWEWMADLESWWCGHWLTVSCSWSLCLGEQRSWSPSALLEASAWKWMVGLTLAIVSGRQQKNEQAVQQHQQGDNSIFLII